MRVSPSQEIKPFLCTNRIKLAEFSTSFEIHGTTVKRIFFALMLVGLRALSASAQLTLADVEQVIAQATTRANQISSNSVIAVTDREGYVLGVWSVNGMTPATGAFTDLVANAT